MKRIFFLAALIIIATGSIFCTSSGKSNKDSVLSADAANVKVYYFHFTRRCATCQAVEDNARNAVEYLYPDEVKNGQYSFTSLNLDDDSTAVLADKLGVGGQCLLIVCGEKKLDITGTAWLAARDPEKMRAEIKSGIDKLLQ